MSTPLLSRLEFLEVWNRLKESSLYPAGNSPPGKPFLHPRDSNWWGRIKPKGKCTEEHALKNCALSFPNFISSSNHICFRRFTYPREPKIRRCYSDTIELNKDALVKLILVDSCFVLELFLKLFYDDMFLLRPGLLNSVLVDLMLLENQLPFFVLDNIFNISFRSRSDSDIVNNGEFPSFIKLAFHNLAYHGKSNLSFHNTSIRHFTDLIRTIRLQHPPQRPAPRKLIAGSESGTHHPSATELLEVGVRFKVNTNSECLLDFNFSNGLLEIPQLKLEDWTEKLIRNMVALEHCHYTHESYITDFVAIWDFLINTNNNVDLLVRKRVLVHRLGDSDSVANFFNSLRTNIMHLNFSEDYFRLLKDLDAFCADPWPKRKVTLRRDYCNSPWQTAATIAGIIILVLTFV